MPNKKYIVDLTEAERNELVVLTSKGTLAARKMKRAQILLQADDGRTDLEIVQGLRVSRPCVLSTHKLAALYEAFAPAEARRIARKLEFHYTPKHGSWLNMAELELSVFDRQCWDRRIGDAHTLQRETQALEAERNAARATVHWRFDCQNARSRMHRLYPSMSA